MFPSILRLFFVEEGPKFIGKLCYIVEMIIPDYGGHGRMCSLDPQLVELPYEYWSRDIYFYICQPESSSNSVWGVFCSR